MLLISRHTEVGLSLALRIHRGICEGFQNFLVSVKDSCGVYVAMIRGLNSMGITGRSTESTAVRTYLHLS